MKSMRWMVVILLLAAGGCGKEGFREVTSAEGRYRVQMPGDPREQVEDSSIGPLHTQSIEEPEGTYVVSYVDVPFPANETFAQLTKRLKGLRDATLHETKGTLVAEKKITLDGKHPGRDLTSESPDKKNALRARIYLVNQRFYQVLVAGTRAFAFAKEADTFLDSFAVTE